MLKLGKLIVAMSIATLALPAIAGSWPNIPARKAPASASQTAASVSVKDVATAKGPVNGFEYVGGEAGWQPAQHKYVWTAGRLAHSSECDHAIRVATAPTPSELESARKLYSGG